MWTLLITAWKRRLERRRRLAELLLMSKMDDRTLMDVGVDRHQIESELNYSWTGPDDSGIASGIATGIARSRVMALDGRY